MRSLRRCITSETSRESLLGPAGPSMSCGSLQEAIKSSQDSPGGSGRANRGVMISFQPVLTPFIRAKTVVRRSFQDDSALIQ